MHIIHGPRQLVTSSFMNTISYCNDISSFMFYVRICGDMINSKLSSEPRAQLCYDYYFEIE